MTDLKNDFIARKNIAELILRRRLQVWVHSVLYYRMNTNLISDSQWSNWAMELEELQTKYPEISASVKYYDIFKDFDHSTGSTLPLDDPQMISKATYLLTINNK